MTARVPPFVSHSVRLCVAARRSGTRQKHVKVAASYTPDCGHDTEADVTSTENREVRVSMSI